MQPMNRTLLGIWALMRMNRPAAFFLIGWPTLAALWLAEWGMPSFKLIGLFTAGIIITRSAGCIINDLTDRKFDGHVERTKNRPLVSGQLSIKTAFVVLFVLGCLALWIVCQLNTLCFYLSLVGVGLTILYPFCKRFMAIPQIVLAITFNWGIIIAFAAVTHRVPVLAWIWLAANAFWTLAYDTQYALCDVKDDKALGLHSSAIYFSSASLLFIVCCQTLMLVLLLATGYFFCLSVLYWIALPFVVILFIYQYRDVKKGDMTSCFKAFKNNQWVGLFVWLGIVLGSF
jgi:4-hydroxybenzoate polyprenyltransferase